MKTRVIRGTLPAQLWANLYSLDDLRRCDDAKALQRISFGDYSRIDGYVQIGTAEVTVTITATEDDIRQQLVTNLRAEKEEVRATAEAKCTEIERKIQELLCITHQPAGEGE